MSVRVCRGADIGAHEFPLIGEAVEYFDVIVDVDDFGVTYFDAHVERGGDYAVMQADAFRDLDEGQRRHLRQQIEEHRLDGTQSADDLAAFVEGLRFDRIARVVAEIAAVQKRGLTWAEREQIQQRVQRVRDDYRDAVARDLDGLLADPRVGRPLDGARPYLELPPPDDETLQRMARRPMPAYFVLDVSHSMAHESRIDHANAFVQRLAEHVAGDRVRDAVTVVAYCGQVRFLDLHDRRRLQTGEGTDTGQALAAVGAAIAEAQGAEDQGSDPAFVALVTDGRPNVGGTVDGAQLDAVDYAAAMAARLPEGTVLSQFAFAPVDPGDPEQPETLQGFERYLADLRRVTDAAACGQTYVIVPESEAHLPWLPLGAWQKAKQLSLLDRGFSMVEA